MITITITNIRNVSINGSPVGALVNAFQESGDPVAVQLALESYCDGLIASHAAALAEKSTELEAANAKAGEMIAAAEEKHAAAIAIIRSDLEVKNAEIAALADFKTRAEAGIAQVVAVIQDPSIDPETTAQTVLAVIAEGTAPEAEREKARIRQQIAELQAKL